MGSGGGAVRSGGLCRPWSDMSSVGATNSSDIFVVANFGKSTDSSSKETSNSTVISNSKRKRHGECKVSKNVTHFRNFQTTESRCEMDTNSWMHKFISLTPEIASDLRHIRNYLKLKNLNQEISVSDESLQSLQPTVSSAKSTNNVKNGLDNNKPFLKVHYTKGYFLLNFLSECVGEDKFAAMLRDYVLKYHGLLITSQIFIDFFYQEFPNFSSLTKDEIFSDWLSNPGLSKTLAASNYSADNTLMRQCRELCRYWCNVNEVKRGNAQPPKPGILLVYSDQLLFFLELLLEVEARLKPRTMLALATEHMFGGRNSDVRHAWCELVIRNTYRGGWGDVKEFLEQEFAMGVYLYGELMLVPGGDRRWRRLAGEAFNKTKHLMSGSARAVVLEMIGPTLSHEFNTNTSW